MRIFFFISNPSLNGSNEIALNMRDDGSDKKKKEKKNNADGATTSTSSFLFVSYTFPTHMNLYNFPSINFHTVGALHLLFIPLKNCALRFKRKKKEYAVSGAMKLAQ
jgi:hypothetical protein